MTPGHVSDVDGDARDVALLEAFASFEFTTDVQSRSIWRDPPGDVPEFYPRLRSEFQQKLQILKRRHEAHDPDQPRGWPLVAPAGAGKSHLISVFREIAAAERTAFILVDMTGVRDFWKTVLEGFLNSLQVVFPDGRTQHQVLTERLMGRFTKAGADLARIVSKLQELPKDKVPSRADQLLHIIDGRDRAGAQAHRDVVRALIALSCTDFDVRAAAYSWLEGLEVDEDAAAFIGFDHRRREPMRIVEGLSWFIGLGGPTVIAFDQLDGIIQRSLAILQSPRGPDEAAVPPAARPEDDTDAHARRELQVSVEIVKALATGLMDLRTITAGTLVVVCCQNASWRIIDKLALNAVMQRFDPLTPFNPDQGLDARRRLIANRLAGPYGRFGVEPPYPTYPFSEAWIATQAQSLPRETLLEAEHYRRWCLDRGRVEEWTPGTQATSPPVRPSPRASRDRPEADAAPPETGDAAPGPGDDGRSPRLADGADAGAFAALDRRLAERVAPGDGPAFDERDADEAPRLTELLQWAFGQLAEEARAVLPPSVEVALTSPTGGKQTIGLHGRLRIVAEEGGPEQLDSFRVIEHHHHTAFRNRLGAALNLSGIDDALSFRHLTLVRSAPLPRGEVTQALIAQARQRGAVFVTPSPGDLALLAELGRMADGDRATFERWARARRPFLGVPLLRAMAPQLFRVLDTTSFDPPPPAPATAGIGVEGRSRAPGARADRPDAIPAPPSGSVAVPPAAGGDLPAGDKAGPAASLSRETEPPETGRTPPEAGPAHVDAREAASAAALPPEFALGYRSQGLRPGRGEPVALPLVKLATHTLIVGGAGSGKTVTIRRIVEEAALRGVPSIVIDAAGDLDRFDRVRPSAPGGWGPGDADLAARFHATTEQVVYTPGRSGRNRLYLEPVPDLTSLPADDGEREELLAFVAGNVASLVVKDGVQAKPQEAVLVSAVRCLAQFRPADGLEGLIDILHANPDELDTGLSHQARLATSLADALRAEVTTNPLLQRTGTPLDPDILLGGGSADPSGRTRIAVISLSAIGDDRQRIGLVAQLASTLFAWCRRRGNPAGDQLRALLVLDEAKDMMPSSSSKVASYKPLVRLTAQGRKYGLGVVLATQGPRELANQAVNNCATRIFGKQSSPQDVQTVKTQIERMGGTGDDIARLTRGQFYVYNADLGLAQPTKVVMPNCLSDSEAARG